MVFLLKFFYKLIKKHQLARGLKQFFVNILLILARFGKLFFDTLKQEQMIATLPELNVYIV